MDKSRERSIRQATHTPFSPDVNGLALIFVPGIDLFDTLFNINAVPGDHWGMVPLPEPIWCTTESWVEVVDTGTTLLSNVPLRWLAVDYHYLAEEVEYIEPDTIVERLGPKGFFMLPHEWCNQSVSPGIISDLWVPRSTSLRRHRPMGRPFGQALLVWSSGVAPQSVTYG